MKYFTLSLLVVAFFGLTNAEACQIKKIYLFTSTDRNTAICPSNKAHQRKRTGGHNDKPKGSIQCGHKAGSDYNNFSNGIEFINGVEDVNNCLNQHQQSLDVLKNEVEELKKMLAELNKQ